MEEQAVEVIQGCVESVTFRREDTGFTVLELNYNGELTVAVGVMPSITVGEEVKLTGTWVRHPSFGRQFKAQLCEQKMPESAAAMLRYLSSRAVKGIGPSLAEKIVQKFGEHTFDVLENEPERLAAIKGISIRKAKQFSESFRTQFEIRRVMLELGRLGLTTAEALRVYKVYKAESVELIAENPYLLCGDEVGLSFARVDAMVEEMESCPAFQYRADAGVLYVLRHNLALGHTCLPRDKILRPCRELLDCTEEQAEITIDDLIDAGQIARADLDGREFLFLPEYYEAERSIAERIQLIRQFPPGNSEVFKAEIYGFETANGIELEERQRTAIETAVRDGLLILTGGPGTGKTTTVKGIITLMKQRDLEVVLAAPTGRAAKRMTELTGYEAKTLHRLLEGGFRDAGQPRFSRNSENPLEADAIIVDELSMVDVLLFDALLDAMPLGCRLILVGDSDQLPPVGAGNVLHDLMESGLIPVVRLEEVFRQEKESMIISNAHRIVRGEMPDLKHRGADGDFFFLPESSGAAVVHTVTDLAVKRLVNSYGYSPFTNIQILCPSRKGETGTGNLNRILQEILNPKEQGKRELAYHGYVLREGDKVMQVRNNYDIPWENSDGTSGAGVFNGDIGILASINLQSSLMTVQFEDRTAVYSMEHAADLELAYAMTVHKSQGSEFDAVIMPVLGVPPMLCYRNLLYTCVTRARHLLILVGSTGTVQVMVEHHRKNRRYSALHHFLTLTKDGN